MSTGDRTSFLRGVPLFAEMDDLELSRLARDFGRRSLVGGEAVFYQGDPGGTVYLVESGRVRIYVHAEDGQEVSVILYGPGDLFGEMSLLDRGPRSATAVAMENTVLWVMPGDAFHRHLRASQQLALNLMLTLSHRLRASNEDFKSLASLDVGRRVIKKLLSLARRQGLPTERGILIRGRLPQHALASLISASRESTNRALRALERKGLIEVQYGQIVLLKPRELESLVDEERM